MFRSLSTMPFCSAIALASATCTAAFSQPLQSAETSAFEEDVSGKKAPFQPTSSRIDPGMGASIYQFACLGEQPDVGTRIAALLADNPMALEGNGIVHLRIEPRTEHITQFLDGTLSFPRFEALHRMLCGSKAPSDVLAVENGPANILTNALAMANMGSRVVMKEIDPMYRKTFEVHAKLLPGPIRSLITYMGLMDEIHAPLGADIVYWANPKPAMLPRTPGGKSTSANEKLFEYMGRDVIEGGFLVIQADYGPFTGMSHVPLGWKRISFQQLHSDRDGTVLNTANYDVMAALLVFQRR